jgi:hypothetical protein
MGLPHGDAQVKALEHFFAIYADPEVVNIQHIHSQLTKKEALKRL